MKKHLLAAFSIFCGTFALLAQVPTNGLVSKWSFEGNLTQDSHGTYTLTNSAVLLDTGFQQMPNTAAYFNGGANLSINNAVFRPTTFSIATWFKRDGTVPYHTLANVRINPSSSPFNSYNLCFGNSTSQKLTFFFTTTSNNDLSLQDTAIIDPNIWTHVIVTCDYNSTNNNTIIKMYVNGSIHAQGTYSNSIYYSPTSKPLTLGSVSGAPSGNSLNGSLDEFLFYNRVLSPTEATNIYNSTPTGIYSSNNIQNSEITLYPNPTNSILNIEVKKQTQISIVNMLGEVVKTETINGASKLDVSYLHAGVYFIQDSKSGKATKFIKQ
jgi:hypothetical protein